MDEVGAEAIIGVFGRLHIQVSTRETDGEISKCDLNLWTLVFPLQFYVVVGSERKQPTTAIERFARTACTFWPTRPFQSEPNAEADARAEFGADGFGSPRRRAFHLGFPWLIAIGVLNTTGG